MDISICFADFPTEAIGDTTRDYRQLGIGYANLGALLMAMGLGYDSDGGRAMAAAHHLADDRHVVQALGRARRGRRPVRRLRPQRRRPQAGDAQAPGRQRRGPHRCTSRDARRAQARHQGVGRRRQARREERLPQRAGLGARADRHHRLHDGLRHHRHRAGLLAGEVQEAGRRRLDADRQPDDPAGAAEAGLPAEEQVEAIVAYIAEHGHVDRRARPARPSTTRSSTPRWAPARSSRWATSG